MTSFYGLVPKVVDRSTLKSTRNPCSDCPEERVDPYSPGYFLETWHIKYLKIEQDDWFLDAGNNWRLKSF